MARMKLTETVVSIGTILERDSSKLRQGVLCKAKYNICNLGELNRNKRIYERAVWDKVTSDKEIQEKLSHRTLFAHAEHPEGMQSSTEKIAGIVTEFLVEGNNVFNVMEVLDTPFGRIVDTLLRAGCGVGVSTRAEGELEECINEADGSRFYRVIPESYKYVTTDWTADPSTYGSFPESVERDLVSIVKSGLESKKVDTEFANMMLEKMVTKEAVSLRESLVKEDAYSDINKASDRVTKWVLSNYGDYEGDFDGNSLILHDKDGKVFKTIPKEDLRAAGILDSIMKAYELDESKKEEKYTVKKKSDSHFDVIDSKGHTRHSAKSSKEASQWIKSNESFGSYEIARAAGVADHRVADVSLEGDFYVIYDESGKKIGSVHKDRMTNESLKETRKHFNDLEIMVGERILHATGHVDYHVDEQYGSDADGNRGMARRFIDDVIIDSVVDDAGVSQAITSSIRSAVEAKVDDMDLSESRPKKPSYEFASSVNNYYHDQIENGKTPQEAKAEVAKKFQMADGDFDDLIYESKINENLIEDIYQIFIDVGLTGHQNLAIGKRLWPLLRARGINLDESKVDQSKLNEQGGHYTTGLGEIWKSLDKAKDLYFSAEAKKKLDESRTVQEKEMLVLAEFKAALDKIAVLEAENAKLLEIAEGDLSSVRANYATDVMDYTKKIGILREEISNVSKSVRLHVAKIKEQFESDKVKLGGDVRAEFETKISEIQKQALDSVEKIYEKKFSDLKVSVEKESVEMREHYNKQLMKLVVNIKVKEASLESEITPKQLALLEACKSEDEIEAKLNEIKVYMKEHSFHSDEFKTDQNIVVPVHETVDDAVREGRASVNQTGHLLKSLK